MLPAVTLRLRACATIRTGNRRAGRAGSVAVIRPVGTTERRGSRILRGRPSTVKAACGVPSGLRYAQALTVEPLRPLRSEERAG